MEPEWIFISIIPELMAQSCVWLFLINIYKKCKDCSKWEGKHTRRRPFIRLDITWMAHQLGHTCTININYFNNVSSFTFNWSVAWPDFSARQVHSVACMMNAGSFIYEPAIWVIILIAQVELARLLVFLDIRHETISDRINRPFVGDYIIK